MCHKLDWKYSDNPGLNRLAVNNRDSILKVWEILEKYPLDWVQDLFFVNAVWPSKEGKKVFSYFEVVINYGYSIVMGLSMGASKDGVVCSYMFVNNETCLWGKDRVRNLDDMTLLDMPGLSGDERNKIANRFYHEYQFRTDRDKYEKSLAFLLGMISSLS